MIVPGIALAQAVRESCCQLLQLGGRTVLTEPDVLSVWMSGAEQSRVCRRIVNYSVPPTRRGSGGRCEMGHARGLKKHMHLSGRSPRWLAGWLQRQFVGV